MLYCTSTLCAVAADVDGAEPAAAGVGQLRVQLHRREHDAALHGRQPPGGAARRGQQHRAVRHAAAQPPAAHQHRIRYAAIDRISIRVCEHVCACV